MIFVKKLVGFLMIFAVLLPVARAAEWSVLGQKLEKCSDSPKTGFYRDGFCVSGPEDHGTHVACATVTKEFLEFTKSKGNDLITPAPEWNFPGLKPGDKWCLCALRWREAQRAGVAPKLDLKATHSKLLKYAPLTELKVSGDRNSGLVQ